MKRNIAKGTPEQFLNLVQNKIAELGGDVEACDNITAASETTYIDDNGIMGEIGDTWTVSELRQYWDAEQMNDPVLSEYDSFDSWLEDTTSQMTEMDYTSDYDKYSKDWIAQIKNKLASVGVDVNSPEAEEYAEAVAELVARDDNHDVDDWWQETTADSMFMYEIDALPHIAESTNITSHAVLAAKDSADINNAKRELQQAVNNVTDGQSLQSIATELSGLLRSSIGEFKIAYEDNDNASTENISVQRIYADKAAKVLKIYEDLIRSFKKPNNFYQSFSAIASAIRKIAENFELDSLSSINDYGPIMRELDKLESADKIQKKLKLDLFNQYYKSLVYFLTNDLNMFKKKPKESLFSSTTITASDNDSTYYDRFIHTLIGDIQTELYNEVDGITVDVVGNSLNIVTVNDGNVTEFNVPNADLSFDFDTIADDVGYVVSTIRETLYPDAVNASDDIDDDDYEISEDTHDMIADVCSDIIDTANNILNEKYGLDEPAEYESREVRRDGNKITCTLWLSQLSDDTTIDITWSYRKDELVLNGSVESYGAMVAEIYAEDYGYSYQDIESATNTCGIACKPEVLSSVNGDVIHGLTWSGLIQELSERGYEVDAAYRRSPDQWIVAYKDGKSYDIEVTRYNEGDYEIHPDNISEVIEADTYVYENDDINDDTLVGFSKIATKSVPDSDGFYTDYTMYLDTNTGEYVFVFGDNDIYSPADGNFDWQCETEEEAWEWFNSYRGFDDDDDGYDDILESEDISPDEDDLLEWFNNASCDVIDAGWTDDGEIIVSLNHSAHDVESMAADLSSCIEDNNYHVTDWNTNGGNVFIFTVIHNEDYTALGGLTDEKSY